MSAQNNCQQLVRPHHIRKHTHLLWLRHCEYEDHLVLLVLRPLHGSNVTPQQWGLVHALTFQTLAISPHPLK